jgi:hypothetical protein
MDSHFHGNDKIGCAYSAKQTKSVLSFFKKVCPAKNKKSIKILNLYALFYMFI